MQLATCSRGVSQRCRANALSLIERGDPDFGKGVGVPIERRNVRIRPWRTLAARHPELVRELDYERNGTLDPTGIAAKSGRKLWWHCEVCGHKWRATVGSRAAGHGCPECYGRRRRAQGPREVSVNGHRFLPTGGHEIPHWWPSFLPAGGHQMSPLVAIESPHRGVGCGGQVRGLTPLPAVAWASR